MASGHAVLAPSSAHRRLLCAGSRAMEAAHPEEEESVSSREGTAAHWAAAELLHGRKVDEGLIADNGVMLTFEMIEAAEVFLEEISAVCAELGASLADVHIEEHVDIHDIHELCDGTPDAWLFFKGSLYVWDFKYGHRYVEVFENTQILEYVCGILTLVGINGLTDQTTPVSMRIVQPRCYVGADPVRTWDVMAVDLRGNFNQIRAAESKAMKDNAPCTVNPECRDCSGRHACKAAQSAAYAAMDVAYLSSPFDLAADELGAELRYLNRAAAALDARRTGIEQQALSRIKRGEKVPFFRLEQGRGRVKWAKPDEEVMALGAMMGVPLSKPKLVTPKQAIAAGLDSTLVSSYSETPLGELKLVEDSPSKLRKIFS